MRADMRRREFLKNAANGLYYFSISAKRAGSSSNAIKGKIYLLK